MTAIADRLPEWIRRRLLGEQSADGEATSRNSTRTVTGGRGTAEPVVVWEAPHLLEAEIVKGRLEAEGIPAIIRSEALGQIYGLTAGGLAKADVLVPAPLAEKAVELLSSEYEEGEDEEQPPSLQ